MFEEQTWRFLSSSPTTLNRASAFAYMMPASLLQRDKASNCDDLMSLDNSKNPEDLLVVAGSKHAQEEW